MTQILKLNRPLISIGVVSAILLFCIVLSQTAIFKTNSTTFSNAVTFDLLLTSPIVYFLLIRKTQIPNITIVPIIITGVIIGSFILPQDNQYFLDLFKKWGLPVIELTVLGFIVFKVRKAIKHFSEIKKETTDFYTVLSKTCNEILPKGIATLAITEIAVIYYGLINWEKTIPQNNEFTYHKKSGSISLLGAIMFIAITEIFVLHILLSRWNGGVAWVLTGLSIYAAIQFFGVIKSIPKRLITINDTHLIVRYGIWRESEIKLDNIESIEMSKKEINKKDKLSRHISPFNHLEGHNVIIHLKAENVLTGLYGYNKKIKTITLNIDEKGNLLRWLKAKV